MARHAITGMRNSGKDGGENLPSFYFPQYLGSDEAVFSTYPGAVTVVTLAGIDAASIQELKRLVEDFSTG
ncbi:MAG: hypothetical protein MZV64_71625 [Ignavibacteriales bacterium]|nr:hypothetical protein [Ignavibacteriales bacterium]